LPTGDPVQARMTMWSVGLGCQRGGRKQTN
jgi:hypothetical protein